MPEKVKIEINELITGNYKVQLYDPRTNGFAPQSQGIGMHVEVRDPEDKIILSKVYSSEGKWTFTSHTPGEHVICLYTNSTKWFSGTQLRVHLDIQVGEHAINYADVAQKEKLSELQLRVRQLLDQVEQITKEQNYQRVSQTFKVILGVSYQVLDRKSEIYQNFLKSLFCVYFAIFFFFQYREERFRQTSESTNSRVLWWSLGQTCILLVMGAWQMRHLKSFFEAKKLV